MKIGITGGIGSGKTYICKRLQELGYPIYICDDEAKRLMQEDKELRRRLVSILGTDAYVDDGLNKALIAQFLFKDKDNARIINGIVHPAVRHDMECWYEKQTAELCFVESALLFEAGIDSLVDKTVLIYADEDVRLQRAMLRDGVDAEKVRMRMAQQAPPQDYIEKVDYVLEHNRTDNTEEEIQKLIGALLAEARK